MNAFCTGDNYFSAGDEYVEKLEFQLQPQTHTASYMYQKLPNRSYVKMIATHMYSPPKTVGITLILTSSHTSPHKLLYIFCTI